MIETREFTGRCVESEELMEALSAENQAGLRQYSLERMMGYGVDYADAIELRSRVLRGDDWQSAAIALANTCLPSDDATSVTRISALRRASAMLRLAQALHLEDGPERREIFEKASTLYSEAAELAGDCQPIEIETANGKLTGWMHPADGEQLGSAIVIGGIEGWAMDFDCQGQALAQRGIDALMLDGPGQGMSRFAYGHYLKPDWFASFEAAIDLLAARQPGKPIGIIGHSMGGAIAMAVANEDPRITACCSNGGPVAPWLVPQGTTFFSKMIAYCGVRTAEEAVEVWKTVQPGLKGSNRSYDLLMVQGGEDPMITDPIARMLFDNAPTASKRMVVFSDGDHCIYRHKQDRDALISDWFVRCFTAGG